MSGQNIMQDFKTQGPLTDTSERLAWLEKWVREHDSVAQPSSGIFLLSDSTYVAVPGLAKTTLFTGTIPGGTLGTVGGIIIDLDALVSADGTPLGLTIYSNYGGTEISSYGIANYTPFSDLAVNFRLLVYGRGTTGTQRLTIAASQYYYNLGGTGTAAIDSTLDQTLTLSALQSSVAVAFKKLVVNITPF